MKICHCIKLTPQEEAALQMAQGILHEMAEDIMIYNDFENQKCGGLDDISAWFDSVVDFLESFGD